MTTMLSQSVHLSQPVRFGDVDWANIPDTPGAYVIYDEGEVIYVGMAGRDGNGSLRRRLRDHASGQIVNMFAQYLFLSRVQFVSDERIRHPNEAKWRAVPTCAHVAPFGMSRPMMARRPDEWSSN